MKLINNQLLKETKKFDTVIWITVSKEMSIVKLQNDIANKLEVTFCGDENVITRVGVLFETLSQKRRFVMILDDLWEKISLDIIGIPEPSTGSKLVLTTRPFDLCRQMGFKEIKISPLEDEEAWHLFLEKVGRDILNIPGLEPIAKLIAKRCAGLPLAIITVASCMKGIFDLSEWRNALNESSVHIKSVNGLKDEVFQQLQFNFDRLKDVKLQQCFLTCALYPEDCEISEVDLVQLWIALGLVEEMDSRGSELDRGHAIMNRLLNNCLLEVCPETEGGRYVKMHDLVRDMALHITSGTPRFLVKAGMSLMEAPDVQEWKEDLEKVSFMKNCELQVIYPLRKPLPRCPMITILLLSDCGLKSIPGGFFKHMDGLKILDLSENPIKSLPSSVSDLKNLTALLLAYCQNLKNVPSLSKLGVLKVLNLESTSIEKVPHGMKNLLNLKHLNMFDIQNLNGIPNGILSKLSCLQYLTVGETSVRGDEIAGLKKLEFLEGRFNDLSNLNMYVQALHDREGPREYLIVVGERGFLEKIYSRKYIELWGCSIDTNQIMLPRDIEELFIKKCNPVCSEDNMVFSRFFRIPLATFSALKILNINNCTNMKRLFSPNCVPLKLQQLSVTECNQLEEIIAPEPESEGGGMVTMEYRLPQLTQLLLMDLLELKSICSFNAVMICDSIEKNWLLNCPKVTRMPLNLPKLDNIRTSAAPSLRIYVKPKKWWESVEWQHTDSKSLLDPFLRFW